MLYRVTHITEYTYAQPVILKPHIIRLRPRHDSNQSLHQADLSVDPVPTSQTLTTDLDGNVLIRLRFADQPCHGLKLVSSCEVTTHCTNPFDYWIEPWAMTIPVDYSQSLAANLRPYLDGVMPQLIAPNVVDLAHRTCQEVDGNLGLFLTALTQKIHQGCQYLQRDQGDPWPGGLTWGSKQGTCRDFAVLFIEACRVLGLGARFVSGYHEGDPDHPEQDLHAWAEVYIPGGGWRGFDPTLGLAVADQHIALAASSHFRDAGPVSGGLKQGDARQSKLAAYITVKRL